MTNNVLGWLEKCFALDLKNSRVWCYFTSNERAKIGELIWDACEAKVFKTFLRKHNNSRSRNEGRTCLFLFSFCFSLNLDVLLGTIKRMAIRIYVYIKYMCVFMCVCVSVCDIYNLKIFYWKAIDIINTNTRTHKRLPVQFEWKTFLLFDMRVCERGGFVSVCVCVIFACDSFTSNVCICICNASSISLLFFWIIFINKIILSTKKRTIVTTQNLYNYFWRFSSSSSSNLFLF